MLARLHRLTEDEYTENSNTAYRKAKANSTLQESFPEKEQHLTLTCNCTTFKGCQTARMDAKKKEPETLAQDAEHQRAEHQRSRHLEDAKNHAKIASQYHRNRNVHVDLSKFFLEKSSDLSALASHHEEIANIYKDQTHGGSGEHKEMLSHSVRDAQVAILTASKIKNDIRPRKEFYNKHSIIIPHRNILRRACLETREDRHALRREHVLCREHRRGLRREHRLALRRERKKVLLAR